MQTAGLADPVRLHQFDLGRPIIQPVERIQQLFGHVADFKEPLREFTTLDLGPGPPAFAINHLLVRENRHIHRVPVHDGVLAVNQPFFEEIKEERLLLAVVFGIAGGEHPTPVQTETQRLHLADHCVDIGIGPILRMPARGHRCVFRGHAKSVKPHRMQHIVPGRQFVPRDHVTHRVVAHMPNVDAARRVRKHLKHIVFRLVI